MSFLLRPLTSIYIIRFIRYQMTSSKPIFALALALTFACCQAQNNNASVTYQLAWSPWSSLPLAQIEDQIAISGDSYTIDSNLIPANWISWFSWFSWFDVHTLQRTSAGSVSAKGQLQPHTYLQRYGERQTEIIYNHAESHITLQDSFRGSTQEPMLRESILGAFDSLSAMYSLYAQAMPPARFVIQFANGRRVREYEFHSNLEPTELNTLSDKYTTFRYNCSSEPISVWYAPDLDWITVKAQFGAGLQALQIELVDISFER